MYSHCANVMPFVFVAFDLFGRGATRKDSRKEEKRRNVIFSVVAIITNYFGDVIDTHAHKWNDQVTRVSNFTIEAAQKIYFKYEKNKLYMEKEKPLISLHAGMRAQMQFAEKRCVHDTIIRVLHFSNQFLLHFEQTLLLKRRDRGINFWNISKELTEVGFFSAAKFDTSPKKRKYFF